MTQRCSSKLGHPASKNHLEMKTNMKKITFIAIVLIAELLVTQIAPAQGIVYMSNLGQTPVGSGAVGNNSWIAQVFITGTNSSGYSLNWIQLLMATASGNPNGFSISLYSNPGNGTPGSNLGNLVGPDPIAGGTFTYEASGLLLLPSTYYSVVVTSASLTAQGAYQWSAVDSFGQITTTPGDPWSLLDAYYGSANGSDWTFHGRGNVF